MLDFTIVLYKSNWLQPISNMLKFTSYFLYSGYISCSYSTNCMVVGWPAKNSSLCHESGIKCDKHGLPSFSSHTTIRYEDAFDLDHSPLLFIWFFISYVCSLIVGTGTGEITLWEIGLRERLVSKPFKLRDIASCSSQFQVLIIHCDFWKSSCLLMKMAPNILNFCCCGSLDIWFI